VVYFVSDRERGKGGLDIWYTIYDEKRKTYKKPRNVGKAINTKGSEMTPYYDMKTQTMYFSSDGKANIGGLDLYKIKGQANKWKIAENMGVPFNSSADDLDFALNPNGKGGYFVSNREGGFSTYNPTCCDDIFEFSYLNYVDIKYIGSIVDFETGDCMEGESTINVYITNDDKARMLTESIDIIDCDFVLSLQPGFDYEIEISKVGFFANQDTVTTKHILKSGNLRNSPIALTKITEVPIVIPDINFNYDSDKLTEESKNVLDTTLVLTLRDNPNIRIEIRAHTDSKGSAAYNKRLSQKRAESVKKYLISKEYDAERFKATGFGEDMPIAPNKKPDGSDNPAGRKKNRRTEFSVIGDLTQKEVKY
jgi:outer membrane protein OmpA-like peptidoglycan-associated protein